MPSISAGKSGIAIFEADAGSIKSALITASERQSFSVLSSEESDKALLMTIGSLAKKPYLIWRPSILHWRASQVGDGRWGIEVRLSLRPSQRVAFWIAFGLLFVLSVGLCSVVGAVASDMAFPPWFRAALLLAMLTSLPGPLLVMFLLQRSQSDPQRVIDFVHGSLSRRSSQPPLIFSKEPMLAEFSLGIFLLFCQIIAVLVLAPFPPSVTRLSLILITPLLLPTLFVAKGYSGPLVRVFVGALPALTGVAVMFLYLEVVSLLLTTYCFIAEMKSFGLNPLIMIGVVLALTLPIGTLGVLLYALSKHISVLTLARRLERGQRDIEAAGMFQVSKHSSVTVALALYAWITLTLFAILGLHKIGF